MWNTCRCGILYCDWCLAYQIGGMRARPRDLGPAEVAGKAALGSQESLESGKVNWVCVLGGSSRQKGDLEI